jgi:hypothetical protein
MARRTRYIRRRAAAVYGSDRDCAIAASDRITAIIRGAAPLKARLLAVNDALATLVRVNCGRPAARPELARAPPPPHSRPGKNFFLCNHQGTVRLLAVRPGFLWFPGLGGFAARRLGDGERK